MTAMYPDSGVPSADARNSIDALSINCQELWYSTSRCQPRFDPAAANAMLAEQLNFINAGEVVYDCNRLDNEKLSIQRQIQRSLPAYAALTTAVPNNYVATLDPPATRYNNGMTLCVVPNLVNTGPVAVNVNGLGNTYILRNDGNHMEPNDFKTGIPYLICYYNGYWFMEGLVPSQAKVPSYLTGDVNFWVRWDGNDVTGDGSVNTADKAFRTVNGCWARVATLYLPSPFYGINIRLGIPGDYEGPVLWNYGGLVRIIGDETRPADYRFMSMSSGQPYSTQSMWFHAINGEILGINICNTALPPSGPNGLIVENAAAVMSRNCVFSNATPGNGGLNIWVRGAGILQFDHHNQFIGDNTTSYCAMYVTNAGVWSHTGGIVQHTVYFANLNCSLGVLVGSTLGSFAPCTNMFSSSNVKGTKYLMEGNAVFNSFGVTMPGDLPGITRTGGQFW